MYPSPPDMTSMDEASLRLLAALAAAAARDALSPFDGEEEEVGFTARPP